MNNNSVYIHVGRGVRGVKVKEEKMMGGRGAQVMHVYYVAIAL